MDGLLIMLGLYKRLMALKGKLDNPKFSKEGKHEADMIVLGYALACGDVAMLSAEGRFLQASDSNLGELLKDADNDPSMHMSLNDLMLNTEHDGE